MTEQSKTKKRTTSKIKQRYNNQSKGSLLGKYDPVEH